MSRVVEAAALMKARAEDASPGDWQCDAKHGRVFTRDGWSHVYVDGPDGEICTTAYMGDDGLVTAEADCTHIAALHPGVASVIADALTAIEAAAAWGDWPSVHAALNRVAETYLDGGAP